jgi:hypothetical protein
MCSHVEVDRRFEVRTVFHHQGEEFITLMIDAVRISETSVYSNETIQRYILEYSKLNTRSRENLKSHNRVPVDNVIQACII